ncbi:MAG: hypothetical protein CMM47_11325 [Rhodospirillaceae bacterium]|nr:hypothetical protein [Rhodospirillaceae bacterium]
MSQFDPSREIPTSGKTERPASDRVGQPAATFDLTNGGAGEESRSGRSDHTLPEISFKKRSADERSKEIVDHLKDMILNPDRADGKTGMSYRDWSRTARKEITHAIREAEQSAAFREFMSANRIGGLCVRVGFMLLATVTSFAAFWYGILFVWQEHGPLWGIGATLSALGLSIAFTTAGLLYGGERRDAAKREVTDRYDDN